MTGRPVWDRLLAEVAEAHRVVPSLREFCALGDDLTPTPVSPYHVPAAKLMLADRDLPAGAMSGLRDAFLAAGPEAEWRETYKDTSIGQDFMDRFACYGLICASGGAWQSAQMSGFVVYMPPGLHYTWHHHPAEEMYLVLAGSAEFLREHEAPQTLVAGDTCFHASDQPHAMTTHDSGVMAYVVWRNNLHIKPVLTDRAVVQ